MTASVTTSTGLNGTLNRSDNKKVDISSPSTTTDDKSVITNNPFLNDFFDCIENLPSKLQILLSELRNVDLQVNARHRKLQLLKQAIFTKISTPESTQLDSQPTAFESFTIEQLLHKLHQLLVQCQLFGDQKVKLTGQIMTILSTKTRQLGFDSLQPDFQLLNEEKIIKDFRMSIKKRSMHHHYNCSSSGVRNSSNRNTFSNNQLKNKNLSVDLNKYPKRMDQFDDVNSNNETNHYHLNSINNSLRNLNVINKAKQQIRHKTITNFQTNKNKIVLNNNNNKKLRLELNSSNSNSPYLGSHLNAFKQDSTTDDSAQNRPKRQLTDNNKTLTDITINKKRRLNQLKQTLNISTDSNNCKSPASTTSSISSNNSKISKRLSLKQEKLKKKYITGKIIKMRPSNIVNDDKKKTKRSCADNFDLDSEDYENFNNDNKTKLDLPSYEDNHLKNSDPDIDRLSNETESINHIDNEDQDDLDDLSDNQLDEDDNGSVNYDAESNIGDDEQEDDENRDDFQFDEDEDSDYKTIKKKPYPSSNEDDLNENSENQSWVFNKSKSNRSKTITTTNTTSTSNMNATNEEEQTYCICEQISYGQMICCDNKSCQIEWFHFNCVKLTTKPKGKWYCPNCRGETHKVMKKTNNKHLTSSSVYHNNNSNSGYLSSSYRAK